MLLSLLIFILGNYENYGSSNMVALDCVVLQTIYLSDYCVCLYRDPFEGL